MLHILYSAGFSSIPNIIPSILLTTARAKPEPMAINDEEETGDNKPYDH
jgi:hypothetical protein